MGAKLGAIGSEDPFFMMAITDPVEVPCCHKIFQNDDKEGIYKWLETNPSCPNCRNPLTAEKLREANRVDAVARQEFDKRARSVGNSEFVLTPCGHRIVRDFMTSWLKDNQTCPHDNTPVTEAMLLPVLDDEEKEEEPPKRQKVEGVAQAIILPAVVAPPPLPAPVAKITTPLTLDILRKKFSSDGQLPAQRQEFAKFSSEVVQKAFDDGLLYSSHHFHLLSDEQFSQLSLSKMRYDQGKNLFHYSNPVEENRRRCAILGQNSVERALELQLTCHMHLSEAQIRALPPKKEFVSQLLALIPLNGDEPENRRKMHALSVAFVQKAVEDGQLIQAYLFNLLSDEQLRALPLSKMNHLQVTHLFTYENTEQENRRRCALIASSEVQRALERGFPCQKYLSEAQLRALPATEVLTSQLRMLIPLNGDEQANRRKMHALSVAFVQKAAENGQLVQSTLFNLLSDDQLRALPLSKMNYTQETNLFTYENSDEENRRRCALISQIEVQQAVERGFSRQKYLSEAQLRALPATRELASHLRTLIPLNGDEQENRRKMHALSVAFVLKAVADDHLSQPSQFNLLSDEQLRALPISKMRYNQVGNLFHYSNAESEIRRRLSLIAAAEVEAAKQLHLPLPKV